MIEKLKEYCDNTLNANKGQFDNLLSELRTALNYPTPLYKAAGGEFNTIENIMRTLAKIEVAKVLHFGILKCEFECHGDMDLFKHSIEKYVLNNLLISSNIETNVFHNLSTQLLMEEYKEVLGIINGL